MHLHLYSASEIPSLPKQSVDAYATTPVATPQEAKDFELWLRGVWAKKEKRLEHMLSDAADEKPPSAVVPISQL